MVTRMSAKKPSPPAKPGTPLNAGLPKWAQPSAQAHELWGQLTNTKPRAAALLHHLVANMGTNMGSQNALVCSQKTLARLMGCSVDTVQRATAVLVGEGWIQTVHLNGPGTVLAYVIHSAVTWSEQHDRSRLTTFNARVVADADDQPPELLECKDLRRIPVLSGEPPLPAGKDEPPHKPPLKRYEITFTKDSLPTGPMRWRIDTAAVKRQAEAMARLKGETEPE